MTLQPDWIAPSRTALLLIDMQVDFALADGAMGRRGVDTSMTQAALQAACALVEAARTARVAVVFVRYVPVEDSAVMAEAKARRGDDGPALCQPGTRGAEFVGPLPLAGEVVVDKPLFNAFAGTMLDHDLKARGVDTLVICGLTTECCVASTAWDAFERDFHVFLAADACAAYDKDLHDGALAALRLSGATIADVAEIAAIWKK
jgi:ureidoacrylate peracid hydrolase